MILALHLKRFKYMDQLHHTQTFLSVVFPLELRLFNTSGDATNPDRMYDLVVIVALVEGNGGPCREARRQCVQDTPGPPSEVAPARDPL